MRLIALLAWGSVTAIVVAVVITAMAFTIAITDIEPVIRVDRVSVVTNEPKVCGKVTIRQDVEFLRDCGVVVDRFFFDQNNARKQLETVAYSHPPKLGKHVIFYDETIPCEFYPGEVTYVATPHFYCNIVQQYWTPFARKDTYPIVTRFKTYPQ